MRSKPDLAAAERYFRQALQVNESYPDALSELATLQIENGNLLSARAFVQRLLAAQEPTASTLLLAWRVEKALGDERAAANFADTLREEFPESPEAVRVSRGS